MVSVPPGALRARTLLLPGPRASTAMIAALGKLPDDPERAGVWSQSGASIRFAAAPIDILDGQLEVPSPIWITRQEFRTYRTSVVGAPIIIFTDERPGVSRLTRFWNVRAAAAGGHDVHVLWMPLSMLSDPDVGETIRRLALTKELTTPDMVLLGPDDRALVQVAEAMGFSKESTSRYRHTWLMRFTRDLSEKPLSYWTRSEPRQFVLGERAEGVRIAVATTITSPTSLVSFESPVAFNRQIYGKIRVEIGEAEAFQWPQRRAVAKLLHQDAEWTTGGLGFVVAPVQRYQFSLRVPEPQVVAEACLEDAGWTWKLSDKGRYAAALVASTPGRLAIPSLSSAVTFRVIQELGSLTSRKAEQVLRAAIPSGVSESELGALVQQLAPALVPKWLSRHELSQALRRRGRGISGSSVSAALDAMIDDHLVHRAFRHRCPNCGLMSHYMLDRARDRVECDGCAHRSVLRGTTGEPVLEYGLNSLVDRAADQDCLGHLLVQDWIREHLSSVWSVPGAELRREGGSTREVDVLAISRSDLIVGEVKTSSRAFTEEVVVDTVSLALDLRADRLILAAMDVWSEDRRAAVAEIPARRALRTDVLGLDDFVEQSVDGLDAERDLQDP